MAQTQRKPHKSESRMHYVGGRSNKPFTQPPARHLFPPISAPRQIRGSVRCLSGSVHMARIPCSWRGYHAQPYETSPRPALEEGQSRCKGNRILQPARPFPTPLASTSHGFDRVCKIKVWRHTYRTPKSFRCEPD